MIGSAAPMKTSAFNGDSLNLILSNYADRYPRSYVKHEVQDVKCMFMLVQTTECLVVSLHVNEKFSPPSLHVNEKFSLPRATNENE